MLSAGVKLSFCSQTRSPLPVDDDDVSGTPLLVDSSGDVVLGSPDSELDVLSVVGPVLVGSVELVLRLVVLGSVVPPASASASSDEGQPVLNKTSVQRVRL
jgi:hypothetical protein